MTNQFNNFICADAVGSSNQLLDILPIIITLIVTIIGWIFVGKSNKRIFEHQSDKDVINALNESLLNFYYPFIILRKQSRKLYEIFSEKYLNNDAGFRTLVALLSSEKKEDFFENKNDIVLLEKIINIDGQLLQLINTKCSYVKNTLIIDDLAKVALHYTLIIDAFNNKLRGETDRFKDYVHPNDLDEKIEVEIANIRNEIEKLSCKWNKRKNGGNDAHYWEKVYKRKNYKFAVYDGWLDEYVKKYNFTDKDILDLGCGDGVNSSFLAGQKDIRITLSEKSSKAIKLAKKRVPNGKFVKFDFIQEEGFPFNDNAFNIIISDLTIHYFLERDTFYIIKEIERILKDDGVFICRVNSITGVPNLYKNYKIEDSFYRIDGCNRRYFNRSDVRKFFSIFKVVSKEEKKITKYGQNKAVWEICCIKKNNNDFQKE